ncbi:MAG: tetratricopeptide repeat protein [Nitrospira sp.]|nr:MAG: tetratricopeptide repeat protein [Nitrospira sp.]
MQSQATRTPAQRRTLSILVLLASSIASPLHAPAWPAERSETATLSGQELLKIGEIHDVQQHWQETLTYYRLALSTFRAQQQPQGIATSLVKIAAVNERQGKIRDAYDLLREAVPLYGRTKDRAGQARALLALGRMSARLGYGEEARSSLLQAQDLYRRIKQPAGRNETLIHLGLLDIGEGSMERGLVLLQQAQQDARSRKDIDQQLATWLALGDAHALGDRPQEAVAAYDAGLALAEAEHRVALEAKLQFRLAAAAAADDRLEDGIRSGKRALLLSQTLHDVEAEAAAWSLLHDFYRRADRPEAEEAEQRALTLYRNRSFSVHGGR